MISKTFININVTFSMVNTYIKNRIQAIKRLKILK